MEDAGVEDGGMEDAGMEDGGMEDAGMEDAGMEDSPWVSREKMPGWKMKDPLLLSSSVRGMKWKMPRTNFRRRGLE